jgi:hypothetical protein
MYALDNDVIFAFLDETVVLNAVLNSEFLTVNEDEAVDNITLNEFISLLRLLVSFDTVIDNELKSLYNGTTLFEINELVEDTTESRLIFSVDNNNDC